MCRVLLDGMHISTLAPLAGSDHTDAAKAEVGIIFQPSLPLRGATAVRGGVSDDVAISTLAPLAGSDPDSTSQDPAPEKFQPSLPLRGATTDSTSLARLLTFQPSLPLRGATVTVCSPGSTG